MPRTVLALVATLLIAGCSTQSHVIVGKVRPPIPPDQVKIYLAPPKAFEKIAIVDASSRHSMTFTAQQKSDKAITRLKEEAGKLGANGVLLEGTGSQTVGSVGTGLGSGSMSGNSSVGIGIGFSGNIEAKVANGLAIFVTEE
jgi:hypothetical protein